MSHALRYGLTFVVLIAGTAGAFYFRDAANLLSDFKGASPLASIDRQTSPAVADAKSPRAAAENAADPFASPAPTPRPAPAVVPVAGFLEQEQVPAEQTSKPPRAEFASRERTTNKPPSPETTAGTGPSAKRTREYIVQPGDSLVEIARCQLGNPGRYREIYDLNRDRLADPNDLYAGMVLRLPDDGNHNNPSLNDAPEFDLEFAPIESDDGYTIVPTRNSQASNTVQFQEPQRTFIPARESPYLPRAFRRTVK